MRKKYKITDDYKKDHVKKEGVIYTTELLKKFAENNNMDIKFVHDYYNFIVDYMKNKVRNEDELSYYLMSFGTLFTTWKGINYEIRSLKMGLEDLKDTKKEQKKNSGITESYYLKAINLYQRKLKKVNEYIARKYKEGGEVVFLKKIRNPYHIRNMGHEVIYEDKSEDSKKDR